MLLSSWKIQINTAKLDYLLTKAYNKYLLTAFLLGW